MAKKPVLHALADLPDTGPAAEAQNQQPPAGQPGELPISGEGVSPLTLPDVNKAINRYERKKEARCAASPDEIAAKRELTALLHQHRDALPVNGDGQRFYRYDGVDYIIEEKLKRRNADEDEGDDE